MVDLTRAIMAIGGEYARPSPRNPTAFDAYPAWDPTQPYDEVFRAMFEVCSDLLWSPETDEEVMNQTITAMKDWNVVGVLIGSPDRVAVWRAAAPDRFVPGLAFRPGRNDDITPDSLRRLVETGNVAVFGEIGTQYAGIAPDDDGMAPYWAVAEELDIPVGIHIGLGPPGVAAFVGSYQARLSSALALEEVLVRHPRLRVYIMHAGWPLLDDLIALLYVHPQVHIDVSAIVYMLPTAEFYRYLQRIVEAGFSDRVMFGSDQMVWPGTIERSIAVIEDAPFLTEEQKRNIFYNNARDFCDSAKKRSQGIMACSPTS